MPRYCVDPVCKCRLEEEKAEHSIEHDGKKVHFCSVECKEEFEKSPQEYMTEYLKTGA